MWRRSLTLKGCRPLAPTQALQLTPQRLGRQHRAGQRRRPPAAGHGQGQRGVLRASHRRLQHRQPDAQQCVVHGAAGAAPAACSVAGRGIDGGGRCRQRWNCRRRRRPAARCVATAMSSARNLGSSAPRDSATIFSVSERCISAPSCRNFAVDRRLDDRDQLLELVPSVKLLEQQRRWSGRQLERALAHDRHRLRRILVQVGLNLLGDGLALLRAGCVAAAPRWRAASSHGCSAMLRATAPRRDLPAAAARQHARHPVPSSPGALGAKRRARQLQQRPAGSGVFHAGSFRVQGPRPPRPIGIAGRHVITPVSPGARARPKAPTAGRAHAPSRMSSQGPDRPPRPRRVLCVCARGAADLG